MNNTDLDVTMAHLNENYESGHLLGVAMVSIYKGGTVSTEYTSHVTDHPARVIGYLTAICHDLIPLVRR